jgi:hypothetical protein
VERLLTVVNNFSNPVVVCLVVILLPQLQQTAVTETVIILRGDVVELFGADENSLAVAQQDRTGLALEVSITTGTGLGFVFFHVFSTPHY